MNKIIVKVHRDPSGDSVYEYDGRFYPIFGPVEDFVAWCIVVSPGGWTSVPRNLLPDGTEFVQDIKVDALCCRVGEVFGDGDRAIDWVVRPRAMFGDRSALDLMMESEEGSRLVEAELYRIDGGFLA